MKNATPLFVIFDGPPAHESGRFVEVETADGKGASFEGEWAERDDGLWSLGPMYSQDDIDYLTKRCEDTETDCEDYSAAHDEARTTIADLRKELERIALDLSSASVTDSFYSAIGQINDIERTARALLAKGGNEVPCVCNGDRDFNISAYRHEKGNDDDQT